MSCRAAETVYDTAALDDDQGLEGFPNFQAQEMLCLERFAKGQLAMEQVSHGTELISRPHVDPVYLAMDGDRRQQLDRGDAVSMKVARAQRLEELTESLFRWVTSA
jgi:hypothetical protein